MDARRNGAPSASERVMSCSARVGDTPRLRLGLGSSPRIVSRIVRYNSERRLSARTTIPGPRAVLIIFAIGGPAMQASAAPVTLWNGVTGDGSLTITTDDFGSFANGFSPGADQPDLFDPGPDPVNGDLGPVSPTAATSIFRFIDPSTDGNGTHRGVFSGHGGYVNTYDDGNIEIENKQANSTDNLPTSTKSIIDVAGPGGVFLQIVLTQTVSELDPGPAGEARAQLEQTYCLPNTGDSTREWIIVKHIDVVEPGFPRWIDRNGMIRACFSCNSRVPAILTGAPDG